MGGVPCRRFSFRGPKKAVFVATRFDSFRGRGDDPSFDAKSGTVELIKSTEGDIVSVIAIAKKRSLMFRKAAYRKETPTGWDNLFASYSEKIPFELRDTSIIDWGRDKDKA